MTESVPDWKIHDAMRGLTEALNNAGQIGTRYTQAVNITLSALVEKIDATATLVEIANEQQLIENAQQTIVRSQERISYLREKLE